MEFQAHPHQQGLQPLADPEQEQRRGHADRERPRIDLVESRCQPAKHGGPGIAARADAEDMLELAGRDEDAAGSDEPADHRVRQQVGEEAHAQQAEHSQHHARQCRQRNRRFEIERGSLRGDRTRRACGHQRHHRNRADRQSAAGAENRIGDQREDRGVEPDHRRQAGQQRIGEALRDQHDGDDDGRHHVLGQDRAIIRPAPFEDGEILRQRSCALALSGGAGLRHAWVGFRPVHHAAVLTCGLTIHSWPLSMPFQ